MGDQSKSKKYQVIEKENDVYRNYRNLVLEFISRIGIEKLKIDYNMQITNEQFASYVKNSNDDKILYLLSKPLLKLGDDFEHLLSLRTVTEEVRKSVNHLGIFGIKEHLMTEHGQHIILQRAVVKSLQDNLNHPAVISLVSRFKILIC